MVQRIPSLATMANSVKPVHHFRNNSDANNDTIKKIEPNVKTETCQRQPNSQPNAQLQAHSNKTHSQLIANSNVMQIFVKPPPTTSLTENDQDEQLANPKSDPNNEPAIKSVLEARETHILKLNKQNVKLQEDNDNLINEIEKMKFELSERGKTSLKLQQELTLKAEQANNEKEQVKKICGDMQKEFFDMKNKIKEKDEQIEQLAQEGLKLSKQELNQSNIIKKLRVKEKENDETLNILRNDLSKAQKELEELRKVLEVKEDSESKNIGWFYFYLKRTCLKFFTLFCLFKRLLRSWKKVRQVWRKNL